MNFKEYIHRLPEQENAGLMSFIWLAKNDAGFPNSADPVLLSKYFYRKLNEEQTTAFQKLFIFYAQFEQDNELDKKYKNNQDELLNGVNTIVFLQNNDSEYKR